MIRSTFHTDAVTIKEETENEPASLKDFFPFILLWTGKELEESDGTHSSVKGTDGTSPCKCHINLRGDMNTCLLLCFLELFTLIPVSHGVQDYGQVYTETKRINVLSLMLHIKNALHVWIWERKKSIKYWLQMNDRCVFCCVLYCVWWLHTTCQRSKQLNQTSTSSFTNI